MIKLGNKVRDKVTGFIGIAVAECVYLNGCRRIEVQGKLDKDGTMPKSIWFDGEQLKFVDNKYMQQQKNTGGPANTPENYSTPE